MWLRLKASDADQRHLAAQLEKYGMHAVRAAPHFFSNQSQICQLHPVLMMLAQDIRWLKGDTNILCQVILQYEAALQPKVEALLEHSDILLQDLTHHLDVPKPDALFLRHQVVRVLKRRLASRKVITAIYNEQQEVVGWYGKKDRITQEGFNFEILDPATCRLAWMAKKVLAC